MWNGANDSASSSNDLVSFVAAWLSIKEAAMSPKTSLSLFTMWIVTGCEEKRMIDQSLNLQQQLLPLWTTEIICMIENCLLGRKHSHDSRLTSVSAQI